MRRLLVIAFGVFTVACTADAQRIYHVVDSVFIHSSAAWNVDRPMYRSFGFSTGYTDTIDYRLQSENREREVPAMPPSTFYALFDSQNPFGPLIDRDVRGVPDSLADGRSKRFALRYVFDIQRATGQVVTFVLPRAFPLGIDSINFRDIVGGTGGFVFSTTLTAGADSVIIPNDALTQVAMIVYFDANDLPSGVDAPAHSIASSSMRLTPNPATGGVVVAATLNAGSRVVVCNVRGEIVGERRLSESSVRTWLSLEDLADGYYFVRAIAGDGSLIAAERLHVRH